jgi:hypothetical protein
MKEESEGNRDVVVLSEIHHCTGYQSAITQGTIITWKMLSNNP